MPKGWRREPIRHALSSKGIKTTRKEIKSKMKPKWEDENSYVIGRYYIRPSDEDFEEVYEWIKKIHNDRDELNVHCEWTSPSGISFANQSKMFDGYHFVSEEGWVPVRWTPKEVADVLKEDPDARVKMLMISGSKPYGECYLRNLRLNVEFTEKDLKDGD